MIPVLLRLAQKKQTYTNSFYLLLSLPLGTIYFAVVIAGVALSAASLLVAIIPLMILFVMGCWKLAIFERDMAIKWLHVDIPPMAAPLPPKTNWFQRFTMHMSRGVTWKSIAYLFFKFPFGVLAFYVVCMVISLIIGLSIISFILGLLVAPFVCLYMLLARHKMSWHGVWRYLLIILIAGGITLAPLYAINGVAILWGMFAQVMLGMNINALRLSQARAMAEQEHAKAERAEQSRRELIMNISHDLKTPVASIRGHIEALLLASDDSEQRMLTSETSQNYLRIVHRESIRLGNLVDDLLSLAHNDSDELSVNLTAVNAGEVVDEVYQTLMPLAKRERQISILREVAPALPLIKADRQRLVQVLLNLVRNAITYTPDGGIVVIALQRANAHNIQLSVADTGTGIPPEEQERIFERFYRIDSSRSRISGGFGLGLAIVRDFVLAMGGSVSVESVVGEGSCFNVLLSIVEHV
jgi:signal transduction histidine kinase